MTMTPNQEITEELVEAIIQNLTQRQRRLLVKAVVEAEPGSLSFPVGGDLRVAKPLLRRRAPLIQEWRFSLYLTKLGERVARELNRTGDWEIPKVVRVPEEFQIEL
jgi:hypothetical protein